jgi:hypothetical protein
MSISIMATMNLETSALPHAPRRRDEAHILMAQVNEAAIA